MSNKRLKKYDERGNRIYFKGDKYESWKEFDKNNNLIYFKDNSGCEIWYKYEEENRVIYYKNITGYEYWCKYDKNKQIFITKKEFEWIKFKKKEKEFNSRTKVSRFQLMDI